MPLFWTKILLLAAGRVLFCYALIFVARLVNQIFLQRRSRKPASDEVPKSQPPKNRALLRRSDEDIVHRHYDKQKPLLQAASTGPDALHHLLRHVHLLQNERDPSQLASLLGALVRVGFQDPACIATMCREGLGPALGAVLHNLATTLCGTSAAAASVDQHAELGQQLQPQMEVLQRPYLQPADAACTHPHAAAPGARILVGHHSIGAEASLEQIGEEARLARGAERNSVMKPMQALGAACLEASWLLVQLSNGGQLGREALVEGVTASAVVAFMRAVSQTTQAASQGRRSHGGRHEAPPQALTAPSSASAGGVPEAGEPFRRQHQQQRKQPCLQQCSQTFSSYNLPEAAVDAVVRNCSWALFDTCDAVLAGGPPEPGPKAWANNIIEAGDSPYKGLAIAVKASRQLLLPLLPIAPAVQTACGTRQAGCSSSADDATRHRTAAAAAAARQPSPLPAEVLVRMVQGWEGLEAAVTAAGVLACLALLGGTEPELAARAEDLLLASPTFGNLCEAVCRLGSGADSAQIMAGLAARTHRPFPESDRDDVAGAVENEEASSAPPPAPLATRLARPCAALAQFISQTLSHPVRARRLLRQAVAEHAISWLLHAEVLPLGLRRQLLRQLLGAEGHGALTTLSSQLVDTPLALCHIVSAPAGVHSLIAADVAGYLLASAPFGLAPAQSAPRPAVSAPLCCQPQQDQEQPQPDGPQQQLQQPPTYNHDYQQQWSQQREEQQPEQQVQQHSPKLRRVRSAGGAPGYHDHDLGMERGVAMQQEVPDAGLLGAQVLSDLQAHPAASDLEFDEGYSSTDVATTDSTVIDGDGIHDDRDGATSQGEATGAGAIGDGQEGDREPAAPPHPADPGALGAGPAAAPAEVAAQAAEVVQPPSAMDPDEPPLSTLAVACRLLLACGRLDNALAAFFFDVHAAGRVVALRQRRSCLPLQGGGAAAAAAGAAAANGNIHGARGQLQLAEPWEASEGGLGLPVGLAAPWAWWSAYDSSTGSTSGGVGGGCTTGGADSCGSSLLAATQANQLPRVQSQSVLRMSASDASSTVALMPAAPPHVPVGTHAATGRHETEAQAAASRRSACGTSCGCWSLGFARGAGGGDDHSSGSSDSARTCASSSSPTSSSAAFSPLPPASLLTDVIAGVAGLLDAMAWRSSSLSGVRCMRGDGVDHNDSMSISISESATTATTATTANTATSLALGAMAGTSPAVAVASAPSFCRSDTSVQQAVSTVTAAQPGHGPCGSAASPSSALTPGVSPRIRGFAAERVSVVAASASVPTVSGRRSSGAQKTAIDVSRLQVAQRPCDLHPCGWDAMEVWSEGGEGLAEERQFEEGQPMCQQQQQPQQDLAGPIPEQQYPADSLEGWAAGMAGPLDEADDCDLEGYGSDDGESREVEGLGRRMEEMVSTLGGYSLATWLSTSASPHMATETPAEGVQPLQGQRPLQVEQHQQPPAQPQQRTPSAQHSAVSMYDTCEDDSADGFLDGGCTGSHQLSYWSGARVDAWDTVLGDPGASSDGSGALAAPDLGCYPPHREAGAAVGLQAARQGTVRSPDLQDASGDEDEFGATVFSSAAAIAAAGLALTEVRLQHTVDPALALPQPAPQPSQQHLMMPSAAATAAPPAAAAAADDDDDDAPAATAVPAAAPSAGAAAPAAAPTASATLVRLPPYTYFGSAQLTAAALAVPVDVATAAASMLSASGRSGNHTASHIAVAAAAAAAAAVATAAAGATTAATIAKASREGGSARATATAAGRGGPRGWALGPICDSSDDVAEAATDTHAAHDIDIGVAPRGVSCLSERSSSEYMSLADEPQTHGTEPGCSSGTDVWAAGAEALLCTAPTPVTDPMGGARDVHELGGGGRDLPEQQRSASGPWQAAPRPSEAFWWQWAGGGPGESPGLAQISPKPLASPLTDCRASGAPSAAPLSPPPPLEGEAWLQSHVGVPAATPPMSSDPEGVALHGNAPACPNPRDGGEPCGPCGSPRPAAVAAACARDPAVHMTYHSPRGVHAGGATAARVSAVLSCMTQPDGMRYETVHRFGVFPRNAETSGRCGGFHSDGGMAAGATACARGTRVTPEVAASATTTAFRSAPLPHTLGVLEREEEAGSGAVVFAFGSEKVRITTRAFRALRHSSALLYGWLSRLPDREQPITILQVPGLDDASNRRVFLQLLAWAQGLTDMEALLNSGAEHLPPPQPAPSCTEPSRTLLQPRTLLKSQLQPQPQRSRPHLLQSAFISTCATGHAPHDGGAKASMADARMSSPHVTAPVAPHPTAASEAAQDTSSIAGQDCRWDGCDINHASCENVGRSVRHGCSGAESCSSEHLEQLWHLWRAADYLQMDDLLTAVEDELARRFMMPPQQGLAAWSTALALAASQRHAAARLAGLCALHFMRNVWDILLGGEEALVAVGAAVGVLAPAVAAEVRDRLVALVALADQDITGGE